jgi:uncharacterized protein (DUF934 family)
MAVLGPELKTHAIRVDHCLDRPQIRVRGMKRYFNLVEIMTAEFVAELLDKLYRLEMVEVHFPVS